MEKTQLEKKFEEFQDKINAIQKAVKQIKKTGIKDVVLYGIIQKSSQRFYPSRYSSPISMGQVKAIIEGIENLDEYVFEQEKD